MAVQWGWTRRTRGLGLSALAVCLLVVGCSDASELESEPESTATSGVDIYAFANGCYLLADADSGNGVGAADDAWAVGASDETPFRMQATALGSYLLYGPGGRMIAADGDDAVAATDEPGPLADWEVTAHDETLSFSNVETGKALALEGDELVQAEDDAGSWELDEASGCDDFPDIDPGTEGEPLTGDVDEPVRGFLDAHTHYSAFRFFGGKFHCGRPWSPYGVTVALKDCENHADGEVGAIAESMFSKGSFDDSHAQDGWPTFGGWPGPDSLTHEGTYWRWIERAWRGGLRVSVNHLVDNRALCELYPVVDVDECNDMASIRQQAVDMADLQDYIDAQSGGPGKGFFRLVTSPEEARKVIAEGKLAVVLGIEVSEVLDCGLSDGEPQCDAAQVDEGLDELHELGVRSVFPVHKFDNALGGTTYDPGVSGLIVNAGNQYVTGEWWAPEPCEPGAIPDNEVMSPQGTLTAFVDPLRDVFGDRIDPITQSNPPTYPPGPHCNPRGLTALGRRTIEGLADRGMIVETDHLSTAARSEALEILEARGYSGLITSHGWGDPEAQSRLVKLGGVVSPYASTLPGFVGSWRRAKAEAPEEFLFGIGFGTDTNGIGNQPRPRQDNENDPVEYPYTTFDGGTTMNQQVSGERTYDVNIDGVAHYGLFPDWIEDMRSLGGDEIVDDLAQGAEAYLQMWERAEAAAE